MDLYSETILDHYQHPRQAGEIANYTVRVIEHNPLCGDSIQLDLLIKNGAVNDLAFLGDGCAISQAAMSLLGQEIKGQKISALKKILPSKVYELLHVPISPGRVKCALLGFAALQNALKMMKKK
jgi:nitrogen fixation NifU-like protein